MKERGILFSAPMVRKLLAGEKTQTRRVVTNKTALEWLEPDTFSPAFVADPGNFLCRYGYAGDRLWVRETWAPVDAEMYAVGDSEEVVYRADLTAAQLVDEAAARKLAPKLAKAHPWKPAIHMPRWASRITLEITDVRAQRLRDISDDDALAEGVAPLAVAGRALSYTHGFRVLWDSINGARDGYSWDANPWVWAISFARVTP
jgi:hypothetical protein